MTEETNTEIDPMDVPGEFYVRKEQGEPFNTPCFMSFLNQTQREIEQMLVGSNYQFLTKAEYGAALDAVNMARESSMEVK